MFKKLVPMIGLMLLAGPMVFAADASSSAATTHHHHAMKSKMHKAHHHAMKKKAKAKASKPSKS